MKAHHSQSGSSLSEINIIPLVDIMLVLLIIFMVAAPMMQQGIQVDTPKTAEGPALNTSKEDLVLSINKDGGIFLGNQTETSYSLQTLEEKLASIYENKKEKIIYIKADTTLDYGYVLQVMALCQKAGIEKVGMITSPEAKEK